MSMHPIVGDQYKHYKGVHHDGRSSRRFAHAPQRSALNQKPVHCPFCREPATAWPIDFGGWHIECRGCGTSADVIRTRSAV
jgi:hypothetical protein